MLTRQSPPIGFCKVLPLQCQWNKLFKNRAAKELADLLAPIIAFHVDFNKDYHYAAYALAMKDTGLIQAKKPNGTLIIHFINTTFGKKIDHGTLSRYSKKGEAFKKIEDMYEMIKDIILQALGREQKLEKDYFQQQDDPFFKRIENLRKAL